MRYRIIPAIMSGGSGTRLWPLSTPAAPKQFHAFGAETSLIAQTAARVRSEAGALSFAAPIVLCNRAHADLAREHLAGIGAPPSAIVTEPQGRNTAATGVIAAALAAEIEPDALVLLMPADHVITDAPGFLAAIERAAPVARERIVTFGIAPSGPETGYGYIERGEEIASGVFAIAGFTEKPDLETAKTYCNHGGYSWNAGIFFFNPRVLLEEFAASPDIRDDALAALAAARRTGDVVALDEALFARVRAAPIDKAVMEKTSRGAVAPCAIGWADVGAWSEIWRLAAKDGAGNALSGAAVVKDARNNLVRSEGPKVCALGVDDLIIVATPDAVIVLPRARAQEVKDLGELAARLADPKAQ